MRGLISLTRYTPCALPAFVIGICCHCAPSDAAVVQPLSIDQLSLQADRIALGTVLDVRSRWNADRTLIASTVTLQPTAMLKGDARAIDTIELVGGTIDGLTLRRTDTPIFEPGDGVVLFINSDNRIVGSYQGAYFTDGRLVAEAEPAEHSIHRSEVNLLRELVDDVAFALSKRPLDDHQLQLPGVSLPNQGRYTLAGYSWAYQEHPMGETFDITGNSSDADLGPHEGWQIAGVFFGALGWWDRVYANFKFYVTDQPSFITSAVLDDKNVCFFCPSGTCGMDPSTIATTYIWSEGQDIIEWDMVFNDLYYNFWTGLLCLAPGGSPCPCPAGAYEIEAVAAHEFGHALGLGHSDDIWATMYPDIQSCEIHQSLPNDDDRAGVIEIYGAIQEEPFELAGQSSGDSYGVTGGNAGDIDGDGFKDIICSAPYNDDDGVDAGRAYVYSSHSGRLLYIRNGERAFDRFGWAVAAAGDVNRDGKGDFIVGAPFANRLRGYVYVYSGANGDELYKFGGSAALTDRFGWSVSGNVDINADGYADIIVGVPYGDTEHLTNCGRVEVFSGKTGDRLAVFYGENSYDMFGWSVAGVGRINSDDYDDFLVGAPFNDDAGPSGGKAYIYSGRHLGLMYSITGYQRGSRYGYTVAGLGRVDLTDGRADYVVASPYYDRDELEQAGRIDVYSGKYGQRIYSKKGEVHGARLGWSVDSVGDYDGDGGNDIIIGTPKHSSIDFKRGRVYIRSGLTGATLLQLDGHREGDQFGTTVGGLDDIDGDDIADFIVGSPYSSDHHAGAGRAYIYRSTEEVRMRRASAPSSSDDSTPGVNDGVDDSQQSADRQRILRLVDAWLKGELLADLNDDGLVDDDDLTLIISGTQQ